MTVVEVELDLNLDFDKGRGQVLLLLLGSLPTRWSSPACDLRLSEGVLKRFFNLNFHFCEYLKIIEGCQDSVMVNKLKSAMLCEIASLELLQIFRQTKVGL